MQQGPTPININIGIIGPPSVGKSALVVRYLTRRFIGEYSSHRDQTYVKCVSIDGYSVVLRIIDSCRNTQMGAGLEIMLKRSHGLLVVFSLTDLTSFYVASALLQKLGQRQETVPFILVGNKADLFHLRNVDYQWGTEAAATNGCPYLEVSAAESLKELDIAFTSITRLALISRTRKPYTKPLGFLFAWWKKNKKINRNKRIPNNFDINYMQLK